MRNLSKILAVFAISMPLATVSACSSSPTQESTGEYVDSSVITTKVRAKITGDDSVSIFDIDVTTYKDVVQLSGFVNTAAEKSRAGQLAASVDGVREVKNNIVIKP